MTCSITISSFTSSGEANIWNKLGSAEEYELIERLSSISRKEFSLIESLFVPVRMNNLQNFAKDFFLPTTTHYDIRIENIVLKSFLTLGAILLDIATLAFRVVTCLPRMCYIASQEEHPLHAYLVEQNVSEDVLDAADHIQVKSFLFKAHTYTDQGHPNKLLADYECSNFSRPVNFMETRFYESQSTSSGLAAKRVMASVLPEILFYSGITETEEANYFMSSIRNEST